MRYVLIAVIGLFMTGCAAITPVLDATTGTTKEQRCALYRAEYNALEDLQKDDPSMDSKVARQARMTHYRGLINATCGVLQ